MPKIKETKPLFIYQFFTKLDIFNGPASREPDNRELTLLKGAEDWGENPRPEVSISLCLLLKYGTIHPLCKTLDLHIPLLPKQIFRQNFKLPVFEIKIFKSKETNLI